MDCQQAWRRWLSGSEQEVEAARRHIRTCAVCSDRVRSDISAEDVRHSAFPSEEASWAGMELELAREERWYRRPRNWSTPVRYAVLTGLMIVALLAVRLLAPRADLALLPSLPFWGVWALGAALLAVALWAGLRPSYLPALDLGVHDAVLVLAAVLGALSSLLPEGQGAAAAGAGSGWPRHALNCFLIGCGVAAAASGAALGLWRGSYAPRLVPASIWAMGGLLAQLLLGLHCPEASRIHRALGHASIGIALLGGLALLRARQPRSESRGPER